MVRVVGVVRLVEVIRVVEVVYRYEENLGVKGPKNKNNKDVGFPMTMPQAAGKNILYGKLYSIAAFFYALSLWLCPKSMALYCHRQKTNAAENHETNTK